jgi:hypothetical protein
MVTFLNGGEPDYLGVPFYDGIELLNHLKEGFLLENWTILDDSITSSQILKVRAFSGVNNHPCYLNFRVTDGIIPNEKRLILQGDLTGTNANLSLEVYTTFISTGEGRLWAAITESHIGLCTAGIDGVYRGIHGGFCDRIDPINDSGAWYIGYIHTAWNWNYVARGARTNDIWHQIGIDGYTASSFESVDTTSSLYIRWLPHSLGGTCDRYTIAFGASSGRHTSATDLNTNSLYKITFGSTNRGTNTCILGEYFLPEGQGAGNWYVAGELTGKSLYFRGVIPNLRVGVGSLLGGEQVVVGEERTLSVGEKAWQGLRIK